MLKIKVNQNFVFDLDAESDLSLSGKPIAVDISDLGNDSLSLIYENKSYSAEIISLDRVAKTCTIRINGNSYTIEVEDQFDLLLKQMGLDNLKANKIAELKAPMPGLVLNILVEENAEVKKGENLFVLEAMKMENIIKASADGTVKKLMVAKGDKVEKNQVLISFK